MVKTARRKTAKRKVAKKKPVRKKIVRKKPARRKPARKKVVRKAAAKRRSAVPAKARIAASSVYEFNDDLSWNIKKALDKYLRLVTCHTGYYKDVKRWTNATIDKIVEVGYELDAAHREYLRMAKRYLKKLKRF